MKIKLLVVLSMAAMSLTSISSCKKDNTSITPIVKVDYTKNGQTISLIKGQSLKLTLGNPRDGGYEFDAPQYNSSALSLTGHTHINPPANAPTGNAGTDSWEFKALAAGESTITITATRSFDKNNPVVMFTGKVAAN